jgi:hypothetical protein
MANLDSTISAGVAGTAATAVTQSALPPSGEPVALTIFRLLLPTIVSIITYFLHSKMNDKKNQNNQS